MTANERRGRDDAGGFGGRCLRRAAIGGRCASLRSAEPYLQTKMPGYGVQVHVIIGECAY